MVVGSLAGGTYLRYTVLMSPKKGETAVHCCDPALSVLVTLVSRNAFCVVSVLSIVCQNLSPSDQPCVTVPIALKFPPAGGGGGRGKMYRF